MDFSEPGQAALEPGKADLIQVYFFQPYPFPDGPGTWVPQVWVADFPGIIDLGDPVYIPNGNIQVHVGP
jgi:hypothetical protein